MLQLGMTRTCITVGNPLKGTLPHSAPITIQFLNPNVKQLGPVLVYQLLLAPRGQLQQLGISAQISKPLSSMGDRDLTIFEELGLHVCKLDSESSFRIHLSAQWVSPEALVLWQNTY